MSISPAVEQVIMKALAKELKERFALVADFATELEKASAFETVLQKQKASAAPSSTQVTISSSIQPAQPPITQTIPARLTRRYADGAASTVPSPMRQFTQPEQTLPPPLPPRSTEAAPSAQSNIQRLVPNPIYTKGVRENRISSPQTESLPLKFSLVAWWWIAWIIWAFLLFIVFSKMMEEDDTLIALLGSAFIVIVGVCITTVIVPLLEYGKSANPDAIAGVIGLLILGIGLSIILLLYGILLFSLGSWISEELR